MEQPAQASVRGLVEDDGRFLFVEHRTKRDSVAWTLPGGRAKVGEDPRAAVAREVFEETSLEVVAGDPIEAYSFTWDGGTRGVVATIFECKLVGGTVDISNNPEPEPIIGYDWVTPGEAATLPMVRELENVVSERRTNL